MRPLVNIHTHHPTGEGIELCTAGIHPWEAEKCDIATLLPLAGGVQAIGEIGLDFHCSVAREAQMACFKEQLQVACEGGYPVVLHCVKAFEEVMKCLQKATPRAVIFHGFIGSWQQAERALQAGYYLSFGERVFSSPKSMEMARRIPLSRLFMESDERQTPIAEIYQRLAALRGITVGELAEATLENYTKIFEK